jgi:hypothetical protein
LAPPKQKKTSNVSVRSSGYVGALATPGVIVNLWKERKIKFLEDGENLD